jgi:hypothetical protein
MSRQWLAIGVVEAPVQAVFTALLAVGPVPGAGYDPAHNANAPADSDGVLRYQAHRSVTPPTPSPSRCTSIDARWPCKATGGTAACSSNLFRLGVNRCNSSVAENAYPYAAKRCPLLQMSEPASSSSLLDASRSRRMSTRSSRR